MENIMAVCVEEKTITNDKDYIIKGLSKKVKNSLKEIYYQSMDNRIWVLFNNLLTENRLIPTKEGRGPNNYRISKTSPKYYELKKLIEESFEERGVGKLQNCIDPFVEICTNFTVVENNSKDVIVKFK